MSILWLAFFLSGIAGISYELVWAKYLVHLFGASTPAAAGTVSIFFSGLALGALLFGRLFDRLSRPVRAYGILEIAIGCTAALVPWMVRLSERWLVVLESIGETWLVRLVMAAIVLLVPATLIGGTFPAMAAVARQMSDPFRRTARFYGLNTLGAVTGCILIGFHTIPAIGLKLTTLYMTLLNVSIGLVALVISLLPKCSSWISLAKKQARSSKTRKSQQLSWKMASILAVCSGLLAIGTEVLWIRALILSFQGTVYVFAVVLTSYLIGIGSGSLLLTFLRRLLKHEIILLGLLYSVIALACLGAMLLFPHFTEWANRMRDAQIVRSWGTYTFATAGMALLAMLPATLAMGASLPLLIGLADIPERESRTAGLLYGLNTLGGIVGSLLATFGLMPWLGLSGALMAHVTGYLALLMLLGISGAMNLSRGYLTALPLILAALLTILKIYPEVNGSRERADSRLLFYKDAPSGTIGIYHDEQNVRRLRINNYYGLSDTSPKTTRLQRRLGHLPMLMHPAPQRALLIGMATGTTLAAMSQYPLLQLDCVELHPTVIEVASYFEAVNHSIWRQPNVRIQGCDGRRFLRRTGQTYDVIVGDLYLPSNAGVGALYSLEHFLAAKNRLASHGVFVAWLPLYQLAPEQVASITKTFLKVFPQAEGWMGHWGKRRLILGLVGWKSPPPPSSQRPSAASIERKLWELSIQESGLEKQTRIQSRQLLSAELLRRWAQDANVNTLDHPVIEYSAPRAIMQSWIRNDPLADKNHHVLQQLLQAGESSNRLPISDE